MSPLDQVNGLTFDQSLCLRPFFELEYSYSYRLDGVCLSDSPKTMMKVVIFIICDGYFVKIKGCNGTRPIALTRSVSLMDVSKVLRIPIK